MNATIISRRVLYILIAICNIAYGQLRELDVRNDPETACLDTVDKYCSVVIKSVVPTLTFEGTLGIVRQGTRTINDTLQYTLQLIPDKRQKIRASAKLFKDTRLEIPPLKAGTCMVFTLCEKIDRTEKGRGTCTIASTPSGAIVQFLELPTVRGETPLTLDSIPAGTWSVMLTRTHYTTVVCTLSIAADDTTVRQIDLKRAGHCYAVNTEPSGAEVYIDGTLAGTSPLEIDTGTAFCSPGEHRYRIVKPLFRSDSGVCIAAQDSVIELNRQLVPRSGLTITVQPADARITVNTGEFTSAIGAIEDMLVPAGKRCEIEIEREGFETYRENIWLVKKEPVERHIILKPEFSGEKLALKKQLVKNIRMGGWAEMYGCGGATPMLLFTPGAASGVAGSGTIFRTTLFFKMIFMNPDWRIGPYWGLSLFGEAMFHERFFLIDAVAVQVGYKYDSRDFLNRVYLDIDGGIKLAGVNETDTEKEAARALTGSDGSTSLWVPVTFSVRYERSISPGLSLVGQIGGIIFSDVWTSTATLTPYPTSGFLPHYGFGVRIHKGFLNNLFAPK